uniref:Uncharacterized protein n=1 Tax=Eutreptiella gymnastica TaxID=73025 RepID=A0A7S1NMA7_9EUGL
MSPEERGLIREGLAKHKAKSKFQTTMAHSVVRGCDDTDQMGDFDEFDDSDDSEYPCTLAQRPLYEKCQLDHGCHHTQHHPSNVTGKTICGCIGVGFRCGVVECGLDPRLAKAHCCVIGSIAAMVSNLVGRGAESCSPDCTMPGAFSHWMAVVAGVVGLSVCGIAAVAMLGFGQGRPKWQLLRPANDLDEVLDA